MITPTDPHVTVALVLGPTFGQFADPLDWVAQRFELNTKVDRGLLMEDLAMRGGGSMSASRATAEALSNDKKTRFRIQLFGRCEGQLVALCSFSINPLLFTPKMLEERSIDIVVLNVRDVLGVQLTKGTRSDSLEGIVTPEPLIRLLPLNVFNRSFFREKLELIENDPKLIVRDCGDAAMIQLLKPWLFYDVQPSRKRSKKPIGLLPF